MIVWVILPAFNEEIAIGRLLPKINSELGKLKLEHRIVVVNDGSTDKTADLLKIFSEKYNLAVITHPINRGLGETERDGFEYVANKCADDDVIIRLDCDDTHEPKYFTELIKEINNGYDVVTASRFRAGGNQLGMNIYRSLVSYSANLFMALLFHVKGIRDYSCGFRAYRGKVIKYAVMIFGNGFIQLKGLGFTSTLETLVKLNLLGCKFKEIPFVLRYDQKAGSSKMITSVTTLGYFAMAFLYYWPFGGWRGHYHKLAKIFHSNPEVAVNLFGYLSCKRPAICKIGG